MAQVVAMTPMAKTAPWAALVTEAARSCLMADPAWTGDCFAGRPERGQRAFFAVMNVLATRAPEALAGLGDSAGAQRWFDDLVEVQRAVGIDPHDYLYQSWAYDAHDVGGVAFGGDTDAALRSVRASVLVLCPPVDWFNPVAAGRHAAETIPRGRFLEIPSIHGHMAATRTDAQDADFLNRTIAAFLD